MDGVNAVYGLRLVHGLEYAYYAYYYGVLRLVILGLDEGESGRRIRGDERRGHLWQGGERVFLLLVSTFSIQSPFNLHSPFSILLS